MLIVKLNIMIVPINHGVDHKGWSFASWCSGVTKSHRRCHQIVPWCDMFCSNPCPNNFPTTYNPIHYLIDDVFRHFGQALGATVLFGTTIQVGHGCQWHQFFWSAGGACVGPEAYMHPWSPDQRECAPHIVFVKGNHFGGYWWLPRCGWCSILKVSRRTMAPLNADGMVAEKWCVGLVFGPQNPWKYYLGTIKRCWIQIWRQIETILRAKRCNLVIKIFEMKNYI